MSIRKRQPMASPHGTAARTERKISAMDKFITRSPKAFFAKKTVALDPKALSKKQLGIFAAKIAEAGGVVVEMAQAASADLVVGAEGHPASVTWLQDCLAQKKLLSLPRKRPSDDVADVEPMAKKAKAATTTACTWAKAGSILWCANVATPSTTTKRRVKIAAFDMDSTLITTKSGKTFAVNDDDWKVWHESVPTKLKSLVEDDGFQLVVFSNQSGLSKGKVTEKGLKGKIEAIADMLALPLWFFLLPENDINRKPRTGAWDVMVSEFNLDVDMTNSFYCGDAAGRPKATGKAKKDFSAGDYKFALNLGVPFWTPEQLFLNSKLSLHCDPKLRDLGFDPRSLFQDVQAVDATCRPSDATEMIVLVGSPAAGKSTFCRTYFGEYMRINQDTLKTPAKCKQAALESLRDGKSVVIDNTNRDVKSRKSWIEMATAEGVSVRCFYLDLPKPLVFHLNAFRALMKQLHPDAAEHKSDVPDMVIHGFFKNLVPPSVDEGFASVVHVPFCAVPSPEDKLLTSFLL
ncbi:hypothetical protein SDRG_06237 [Saprolegnia diclina VS20]|uniref:Polynucleotide kinase 3'-phosphatase n=1 Tax=Saprolegnia diclina (strain VS20) TaxID=1156394 RepID=T0QN25_SAPDV|nr:hypothetical protein SDRG_06237 [Saprolegnia diclina VS20]EQC36121.1 hypothetical protein SDRG_06237 [Saprolegnia diclina VS20]|eukprot:XP_008610227.1 hypothetical protein SDRG_06237 [Saprolegnia diclina VS20]